MRALCPPASVAYHVVVAIPLRAPTWLTIRAKSESAVDGVDVSVMMLNLVGLFLICIAM